MSGPGDRGEGDDAHEGSPVDDDPSDEGPSTAQHPSDEEPSSATDPDDLPGVPMTKRARAKSAVLWGLVGGLAFLVLTQGYLLAGGELPFRYAALFAIGAVVAAIAAGIVFLTEHRVSKRRT